MTILLAAVAESLAAGFQGAHNLAGISQLLSIPPQIEVLGVITLGYAHPAGSPGRSEQARRPKAEAIHRETWTFAP